MLHSSASDTAASVCIKDSVFAFTVMSGSFNAVLFIVIVAFKLISTSEILEMQSVRPAFQVSLFFSGVIWIHFM